MFDWIGIALLVLGAAAVVTGMALWLGLPGLLISLGVLAVLAGNRFSL
jgi:hypothetical protein